ncbi:rhodanese-like domain-containing protein [Lactococcus lactis]|jgi:rhodanese-related sulfurtransferase|uniref:Sulfurtransferase n=1 Tax=Lactococcus lactis TaxID=1358 RepID=A0AAP8JDC1_9LACT|nr:rhodanese-like domain-containing protein [Lactococcus lactis]AIS04529.1 sulfurtransferase [Lactococcus lactis]MCQ4971854.1 rhodanese-like domain-containing protein [Lactococcus lactis]MCQ4997578.1 rhodanese-like domain-containing protein [Lactococcus lactis]MCT3131969.1 rhodanese-like domain-containing protein [Lactococcus lactis]MCU5753321.1 rhodanese-like domain-containing protein [Lactococcus lactis]
MQTEKIEFLKNYLSLYINHDVIMDSMNDSDSKYVILDVRNAPNQIKKDQIKGALAIPAKDLKARINELDQNKVYVVYDWTAGTTLGKVALFALLSAGFEAFELSCALEGWKGMNLPVENIEL